MHIPPPIKLKQFLFSPDWILYQDESLLVVNKPSGLLSVPGRGPDKQHCLLNLLLEHFPDALIVHRLDMDTSGIIVLARNKETHRHLSRQFQERQTKKSYVAVCAGQPSQSHGECRLPMRCDWEKRPLQMIDFQHGKHAHTLWHVRESNQQCALIELTPITGRSHQLRLHLKSLGHPILGDNLYADPTHLRYSERLMLHAQQLSFTHPVSLKPMNFTCPARFNIDDFLHLNMA